jgi:uncharacterized protein
MRDKKYIKLIISICITLTFAIVPFIQARIEASQSSNLPKLVTITSYGTGTSGHIITSGLSEAISKFTPMDARVEPGAGDIVRINPLKDGTGEFALVTQATGYLCLLGQGDFGDAKWGPQPIRMVWLGPVISSMSPWVRGDSDIKSLADLKGKRVAKAAGASAYWFGVKGLLAYGGLTLDDVVQVPVAGYSKQFEGLLEGSIDVAFGSVNSAKAMETATSAHGIRWLRLDPNDKEAWARCHKYAPWIVPIHLEKGAGISPDNPLNTCGYQYTVFAFPRCAEEIVYNVPKIVVEHKDYLKPIHTEFKNWTIKNALDLEVLKNTMIPYHQGSIKYFKELGKWTPEHQAWQSKVLELEKKRMEK